MVLWKCKVLSVSKAFSPWSESWAFCVFSFGSRQSGKSAESHIPQMTDLKRLGDFIQRQNWIKSLSCFFYLRKCKLESQVNNMDKTLEEVIRATRINPQHAQAMADASIAALRRLPIEEKDGCEPDPDQTQKSPTNIDNH